MLLSDEERDRSLGLYFAAYSSAPTEFEVALFVGDPAGSGVELDATGGYARVTVPNDATTWPDAPAGGSITSAPIAFPAASGAWQDTPTHFQLFNADTGDAGDTGVLDNPPTVLGAGVIARVSLTVFYNDLGV